MIEVAVNHVFHENEEKSGEDHFHQIMKSDIRVPFIDQKS